MCMQFWWKCGRSTGESRRRRGDILPLVGDGGGRLLLQRRIIGIKKLCGTQPRRTWIGVSRYKRLRGGAELGLGVLSGRDLLLLALLLSGDLLLLLLLLLREPGDPRGLLDDLAGIYCSTLGMQLWPLLVK